MKKILRSCFEWLVRKLKKGWKWAIKKSTPALNNICIGVTIIVIMHFTVIMSVEAGNIGKELYETKTITIENPRGGIDDRHDVTTREDEPNNGDIERDNGKGEEKTIEEKIAKIADIIFTLESSRGINNYSKCEAQGLYNRFGYGIPGDGTYRCYEKDEDTEAVKVWIADKLERGFTEGELACYYNEGIKYEGCPYYQNFKSLK